MDTLAQAGRPYTLVLLPGLDGTGVLFEPLLEVLPAHVKPLVVTYPPDRTLGYDDLDALVSAALPAGEPFVLLGESFSGPLAVRAAERRPAGLLGLVLCATFVSSPAPYVPRAAHGLAVPQLFQLFPVFARAKALATGYSTRRLQRLLARAHGQVKPAVFAARLQAVLQVDVTASLRACPVPVLYIRGSLDMVVPPRCLSVVQTVLPSVTTVILTAPHLVLQVRPAEAARAIDAWVGGRRLTADSSQLTVDSWGRLRSKGEA